MLLLIKQNKRQMSQNRNSAINIIFDNRKYVQGFFIIFYLVGIVGLLVPFSFPLFVKLVPLALVLSFGGLYIFHEAETNWRTVVCFVSIYLLSFIIEAVGVYNGLVFGHYNYASSLGPKLFETPLIIGINWFFLVYTTTAMVENFKISAWFKVLLASSFMLVYDIVMEQVAPMLDMWHWENNSVPLLNYLAWFVLALLFNSLVKLMKVKIENKLAAFIFICQFLFFLILFIANTYIL